MPRLFFFQTLSFFFSSISTRSLQFLRLIANVDTFYLGTQHNVISSPSYSHKAHTGSAFSPALLVFATFLVFSLTFPFVSANSHGPVLQITVFPILTLVFFVSHGNDMPLM